MITHEEAVNHLFALMKYCYGECVTQCEKDCVLCVNDGKHCVLYDGFYHSQNTTRDAVWKRLKELKNNNEKN